MSGTFTAVAWNNGSHRKSGAGYGLKVSIKDRDRYFDREWTEVQLHLPTHKSVRVNIDKQSFWGGTCRELISNEIGKWLHEVGRARWPRGMPPRVLISARGGGAFDVHLVAAP